MVQQEEIDISIILVLGTAGMLVLATFIVVLVVLYKKRQISQQLTYERDLLDATIQTQEKERFRIARDLHDGIGAVLSTSRLHIHRARKMGENQEAFEILSDAIGLIDESIENTRRISRDLLPPTLNELGLAAALDEHCERLNTPEVEISFNHSGTGNRIGKKRELALFRVVQELLQNALKHAEATHIDVLCKLQDDILELVVSDNGKGFNKKELDRTKGGHIGLGLKSIESRMNVLNADLNYAETIGGGTKVSVYMKLNKDQFRDA